LLKCTWSSGILIQDWIFHDKPKPLTEGNAAASSTILNKPASTSLAAGNDSETVDELVDQINKTS